MNKELVGFKGNGYYYNVYNNDIGSIVTLKNLEKIKIIDKNLEYK